MIRRSLLSSMRWGTTLTVNMPMLASNLKGIEAVVGNNATGVANTIAASLAAPPPAATASSTLLLPMVKGNAYGCGILPISHFLSTQLGYKTLGVASLHEAIHVLERLPEIAVDPSQSFVVFSDTELQHPQWQRYYSQRLRTGASASASSSPSPNAAVSNAGGGGVNVNDANADAFAGSGIVSPLTKAPLSAKIIPVIGCKEDLHYFLDSLELCGTESPFFNTPLFIKVDTGMNRMGLSPQELVDASPRIRRLRPSAQTDINGNPLTGSDASLAASASASTAGRVLSPTRSGIDLLLTHFASSWFPVGREAEDVAFLKWVNTARYNAFPTMTTSQKSILMGQHAHVEAAEVSDNSSSSSSTANSSSSPLHGHSHHSHHHTNFSDIDEEHSIHPGAAEADVDSPSATAAASATASLPTPLPPFPLNRTLQQFHAFKVLEIYLSTVCGIRVHNVSVSNSGGIEQKIGCGFYTSGSCSGSGGNGNGSKFGAGSTSSSATNCGNGNSNSSGCPSCAAHPPLLAPANVIVRPGLMMYGPPSVTCPRKLWDGKTIGRLETKIVKTFVVGGIAKPARPAGKERILAHIHSQKEQRVRSSAALASKIIALRDRESASSAPALFSNPHSANPADDAAFVDSLPPLPLPLPLAASSGSCVGYSFNATRGGPTVVAVLAIGYADGFLRYNTGLKLEINGLAGEVHGYVNMDLAEVVFYPNELEMTVEEVRDRLDNGKITSCGGNDTSVSIWGHDNSDIDTKASFLKTNPYQLLTALSVRVPRVYEYGDAFQKPCIDTIEALKWDTCRFV